MVKLEQYQTAKYHDKNIPNELHNCHTSKCTENFGYSSYTTVDCVCTLQYGTHPHMKHKNTMQRMIDLSISNKLPIKVGLAMNDTVHLSKQRIHTQTMVNKFIKPSDSLDIA